MKSEIYYKEKSGVKAGVLIIVKENYLRMNLSKIAQFVKENGDKFILIENGEPQMVVMSFQEYEKIVNGIVVAGDTRSSAERGKSEPSKGTVFEAFEAPVVVSAARDKEDDEDDVETVSERRGASVRLEDIRLEDLPI